MARKLSQEHIDAYLNGIFKNLFRVIKEDPELSLEIRRNNEAMVYYRKGKILTTGIKRNKFLIVVWFFKCYCQEERLEFIRIWCWIWRWI